jgi:hypothetical protein
MPRSFFGRGLAARGKLRRGADRRGLGGLSAGVGVNLGIHDQHVHVEVCGQHVIQAAEADIVGPAVAAVHPDGLLGQLIGVILYEFHVRAGIGGSGNKLADLVGHGHGLVVVVALGGATAQEPP